MSSNSDSGSGEAERIGEKRDFHAMPDWIRKLLFGLQLIAVIVIIILFLFPKYSGPMYITGVLAAAAALYAFQTLMGLVPRNLDRLYDREIIVVKNNKNGAIQVDGKLLEEEWAAFFKSLEYAMNHYYQYILGFIFAGISVVILVYQWGGGRIVFQSFIRLYTTHYSVAWRLRSILEPLAGFIMGLMAWRMLMVGLFIWQIGKKFDLKLQSGHPDECGGLEPLGIICLWNALITTIPAIFLGFWIFIGPSIPHYAFWEQMHLSLLPVPMAFAFMSFVLPMYTVHQVMEEKRDEMLDDLDRLGQEIDQIETDLMDPTKNLKLKQREEKNKLLKMKREQYEEKKKIPVWPVNSGLVKKFITSQAVPVLGLTGLGEPVTKLIESLLKFINSLA